MSRKKIWYLIGTLSVGGTERTLVDLVNNIDKRKFTPTIWTISDVGPLADDVVEDIPVNSLNASHKLDPGPLLRLTNHLQKERPAVLQSFLYFDNLLARLVGLSTPVTTVISGVRDVPNSLPLHRDLSDRLTLSLSDHIVSNSESGAEWIVDRGAKPEKVSVVHNGREIEQFETADGESVREELSLNSGKIVGTVGRLIERKGHRDLIQSWPQILSSHPDSALLIVGDGPERESLETQARNLCVADSVHFTGVRDDVPRLLSTFDVFVFPSYHEGLPGALLEAMAAGVPIVTTPVDGCSELVANNDHGVHVPAGDPEAIATEVVGLLSNSERAEKLGVAANRRAREHFSVDAMVSGFESLYDQVS